VVVVEEVEVATFVTVVLDGVTVYVFVITEVTFGLKVSVYARVDVSTLAGFLVVRRVAQIDWE
jgi:hypothetical protein